MTDADRPRVWVDFSDWGMQSGRAFLAALDAVELPAVPEAELSDPRSRPGFALRRVELRDGQTVRLMVEGEDARSRPFRWEADGIVRLDAERGWYAEFDPSAYDEVLWDEPMT